MTGQTTDLPHGVLVSSDAGTPSAYDRVAAPPDLSAPGEWDPALDALEFPVVLRRVAAGAAGPLGAASVLARRPQDNLLGIREELARVEELAGLIRAGKGLVAEAVPDLGEALPRLRIPGSVLDGPELLGFRRTLTAARLVIAELARVAPDAPRVALLARPRPEKSLERRLEQSLDDDGGVLDGASPALASARSDVRTARERLVQRLEALLRGAGGEGGVTLREGRYVIPVPRDLRGRPDGIVHAESASGATLYLEPAAAIPLGNALREAEARALREELKVLRALTEMLRPEAEAILDLHTMCVEVDDLAARGRWAARVDGHAPVVAPAPAPLRIVDGRHPLLLEGEDGSTPARPPVPFDLALEPDARTVLLSGPNTGGKSVLLKAVGLQVALTQSGVIPPLGPGSALPVFTRVFADIGDRQSIAESLSTFSAHLALLRTMLDRAGPDTLVLLDEIGSGTDPAEGAALAAAVLLTLTARGAITLATTHLGALKELATRTAGVVNASLQFDAATLQPTYRLQLGVPGRSYGLAIARRLGLPDEVLALAESRIPEGQRTLEALLAAVEERSRRLAEHEAELARQLERTGREAAELRARAESQQAREAELRRRERDGERQAREQARHFLLEARTRVEDAIARASAAADPEQAREARRIVESAAAAEASALAELGREGAGAAAPTPALEPGQRVRLHSGTVGVVLELRADGKAMVRVGSLKLVADPAGLTVLPGLPPRREAPLRGQGGTGPAAESRYEVDLRGLTGDEAEQTVLAALDAAILAEQPYLRIIHGKGTGVVRERVQQVVRRDRRVRSHAFAPPAQGGTGVTVVEFGA